MLAAIVNVPIPHDPALGIRDASAFLIALTLTAIVTTRRPAAGLVLFMVAEPFAFSRLFGPTTITLPKCVLLGLIFGLIARRTSLHRLRDPSLLPVIAGISALIVFTGTSMIPATFVDPVVRETLKTIEYAAIFFAALLGFSADPDEQLIWQGLTTITAIVSVVAIAQEFSEAPSGFYVGNQIVARVAGPLEGPNQLAGWFAVALPTLTARFLSKDRSFVLTTVVLVAVAADALTYSRAGLLGLAVGIGCVSYYGYRRRTPKLVKSCLMVAVTAAVCAALPLLLAKAGIAGAAHRLSGADEQSVENGLAPRTVLWRAALQMFARDPGLGVGAGNFEFLTPTVGLIGVRTHANSYFLQSLAEGGIALFSATIWTIGALLIALVRKPRSTLALGIAAGTVALTVHQIFDTLIFYPKVGDLWWLLLGIGVARTSAKHIAVGDTPGS